MPLPIVSIQGQTCGSSYFLSYIVNPEVFYWYHSTIKWGPFISLGSWMNTALSSQLSLDTEYETEIDLYYLKLLWFWGLFVITTYLAFPDYIASPLSPHWQLPDLPLEPSLFPRLQAHTSSCSPSGFTWTSHSTSHTWLLLGQHSPHPHHSRPAPPPLSAAGPRPCSLLRLLIPNFSSCITAYRFSFANVSK